MDTQRDQGWRDGSLADVLETLPSGKKLQMGWSPQCLATSRSTDRDWAVLKTTAVQPGEFHPDANKLLPSNLEPRPAIEVKTGDLLLTNAGPRARCGIPCLVRHAPPRLMLSGKIYRFRADATVMDPRFLEYYLLSQSAQQQIEQMKTGISDSGLNLTHARFLGLRLPIPALDEQRRIVAILEDHLSRLDAATWGLRAADARSDALQRRAIVELLSVGGPESELRNVLEVSIGGLWGEPPGGSDLDVMVIRVTELGMWGALDPRTSAIRSVTHKQYESRSLQLGDLLLEKSGGGPATPVGRVGLVTGLEGPAICSNFMQLMRPDRSRILPRWLHLYLNACHLAGRTNNMQKASTNIRNIKASEYLQMVISVPTLDEQESVVAACESWLLRGSRLKATVGELRGRAVVLRRALLQSAFSGELTRESISV